MSSAESISSNGFILISFCHEIQIKLACTTIILDIIMFFGNYTICYVLVHVYNNDLLK